MAYFIGNVLPTVSQANAHEEKGDISFHIDRAEGKALNLEGLPLHIEHSDGLQIGEIVRSWDTDNGRKWIIGKLSNDTVEGKFACRDALSDDTLYTGLSLQHVYTEYTNNTSTKKPIEVSICKVPRRDDCSIRCVVPATKTRQYKTASANSRTMTDPAPTTTTEAPVTAPPSTPVETAAAASASAEDEKLKFMEETVKMAEERDAERAARLELENKLQAYEDEKTAKAAQAKKESQSFIDKMTESVLEQVAQASPEFAGKETEEAIATLKEQYPNECRKVLEVACCASNKVKELEARLAAQERDYTRKAVEEKYLAAIHKEPGVHGDTTSGSVEVRASKKQRTEINPYACNSKPTQYTIGGEEELRSASQIREAYAAIRGGSSSLDNMGAIADIARSQRRMGHR